MALLIPRRLAWLWVAVLLWPASGSAQATPAAGNTQITRAAGTIKAVQGNALVVTLDAGGETSAAFGPTTKILRLSPGEKDLKNAVPLSAQDLQAGDRVLVRGTASPDGHAITALAVIVMKQADVSAKQQRDRDDWQKRGVDGLVTAVDPASGTVTISSGTLAAAHKITISTTKDTILRRYAPSSIKFEDAKPAPLDHIKPGDQLRARGNRNADGSEFTAEEVVSGTFRNIAGTVVSVDASTNTLTVQDLIAKAPVVMKFTADSQMKKLPPEFAQHIAMRLKGGQNGDGSAAMPTPAARENSQAGMQGPGGGAGHNGSPSLQRMLSRLPDKTLADLQKGDVVMVLSTDGSGSGTVSAITLLAGVEPILAATSSQNASTILSPWSLSSGSEGEGQP